MEHERDCGVERDSKPTRLTGTTKEESIEESKNGSLEQLEVEPKLEMIERTHTHTHTHDVDERRKAHETTYHSTCRDES
jgi:hypothetical protein